MSLIRSDFRFPISGPAARIVSGAIHRGGIVLALLTLLAGALTEAPAQDVAVPPAPREFRGLWIATVNNTDWPSKANLTTEQQKAELAAILDRARQMKLNAVVFQVRPACDAFYRSELEPWSVYLTGKQGEAPEPDWDPLEFAVDEAHRRGLELHAWFNPYRAGLDVTTASLAPNHIAVTRPDLVYQYGKYLWMDPGKKDVQAHSMAVILDGVRRYDIDAVHFDDYFYPYPARDTNGRIIPFPDDATYADYKAEGGTLARDKWREENVNTFIRDLAASIKAIKPHVRFGISPFGIWRPGYPSGVVGMDSVAELHADSRKWLREGWIDYLAPQLYWKLSDRQHGYGELLRWWIGENVKNRHVYVGNGAHHLARTWKADEIVNQVLHTRTEKGALGNIFFNTKVMMENRHGIVGALSTGPYAGPALVPAYPWIDNTPPPAPRVKATPDEQSKTVKVEWEPTGSEKPFVWAVYAQINGAWKMEVLPASQMNIDLPASPGEAPSLVAVSAVSRGWNESDRAAVHLAAAAAQMLPQLGSSSGPRPSASPTATPTAFTVPLPR